MKGQEKARLTRRLQACETTIAEAAAVLQSGGLVAFPTETVYGLGADARSERAVAALYEAKGRPSFNPLIAHVASLEAAAREGVFSEEARALAQAFWPGPLTLVLPVAPSCGVCLLARAGLDTLGLRMPDHPVARALLERFSAPIAAPSANLSGAVSPTRAEHVLADLSGRIDLVIDGGPTGVGVESTIVACLEGPPRLLRPGGLAREAIESVLGRSFASRPAEAILAPGMLASHYAPHARLRLDARDAQEEEAALDFGGVLAGAQTRLDLSEERSLSEAAANLFAFLRLLDASGARVIAVAPIPEEGLGEAINDRLRRAAAPR
ncbi:MAG TPA: L-threonylcarbamoyladenylate synthase [Beijerinckiaceae bacterium]|nr:L-threonylcarbamoyladenylate synthase [Beijerinckiaceae bacterium]